MRECYLFKKNDIYYLCNEKQTKKRKKKSGRTHRNCDISLTELFFSMFFVTKNSKNLKRIIYLSDQKTENNKSSIIKPKIKI